MADTIPCSRFRFSTAGGLSFTGPADDGEVEDHLMEETSVDVSRGDGGVGCFIATAASESIREIHHRMPVILNPKFHEKWLNSEIQDQKELEIILQDGITHDIKYYPVSTLVNSVKNNDPNCIKPIKL